jgi:uncharacterized protein YlaI
MCRILSTCCCEKAQKVPNRELGKKRETVFWCPDCEAGLCLEAASRLTTPRSTFKVKFIMFFFFKFGVNEKIL